jgi:HAD superfamily phosphatase (TIGR01668 family)
MGLIRLLTPHLCVDTVLDLGVGQLRELGLDTLLLDVDCTLKRYRHQHLDPEIGAWIAGLRAAGFKLCLLSNGGLRRIRRFARQIGVPAVCRACKPLPFGCYRAIRKLQAVRQKTAIVGDQLFADILAGRLAGLFTIRVRPIHPEDEPWFTRVKRPIEARLLRRLTMFAPLSPEGNS